MPEFSGVLVVTDNLYGGVASHAASFVAALHERTSRIFVRFLQHPDAPGPDRDFGALDGIDFAVIPLAAAGGTVAGAWSQLRPLEFSRSIFLKGSPRAGSLRLDLRLRQRGPYLTLDQNCPPGSPTPVPRWDGLRPRLGLWHLPRRWRSAIRWRIPDRVLVVSEYVRQGLRSDYGCRRSDVLVFPNGCDTSRFRRDDLSRAHIRAAWGVPPDGFVLGSVGRLERRQKGLDILIDAVAQLQDSLRQRGARVVLVGPADPAEEAIALQELAGARGVSDLLLMPGPTPRPEEAWNGFDLAVFPSRYEGASLSLLEAMASERPVLATPVGSVREVITPGVTGEIVAPGELAAAIQGALATPAAALRSMGERARHEVVSRHDARVCSRRLADAVIAARGDSERLRNTAPGSAP